MISSPVLDLITNNYVHDEFSMRSKIINYLRHFLDNLFFLEVDMPMMNQLAGGAAAKPFITLKLDLFMDVALELFLKMPVIDSLDLGYDIGRQFRNEGIDLTHNSEFTTDIHDKVTYHPQGPEGPAMDTNFIPSFYKVNMMGKLGVKFPLDDQMHTDETKNSSLIYVSRIMSSAAYQGQTCS
ncbi:hypothetical protein BC938DRAFT_475368 [Jimgerdemannia flammicorona]|uniref:Aminoacyl-tRNA synthetase class II (D/K/N) domain-containing protein n=1 Tax=Jimgerdemannia flammicorona TaxID=994334 RepID=A0A433QRN6_9FUNG|nr:hypothetical protein BC938DRAFT_475368 [Jimgerdemannia flammicorona]